MLKSFPLLSVLNMILVSLAMGGALAIAWIGWLRTRRSAYLILVAWALTTMIGSAVSWVFFPMTQKMSINTEFSIQLMMWFNLGRAIITSLLLLAGLGTLVFNEPRQTPAP